MDSQTANNDLVWDLDAFEHRNKAAEFIKRFENKLCVYSGSVEQLYSNYNIYFPEDEGRKMVILPDPYAYHDTFQSVPEEAIKTTGLVIVPGELFGKQGLYISIPFKVNGKRKIRMLPLHKGLELINKSRSSDQPFLPVLIKGDLREFKQKVPSLHLHTIELDRLGGRSTLERNGIRQVISQKLPSLV
jgi:hypothetical protein